MATHSFRDFKSSGKTLTQVVESDLEESRLPISIKTPLRLGTSSEGILGMHFDSADAVHDNFRSMLLTNWGERLAICDFGGNLRKLVSEYYTSPDFDGAVMSSVQRTTSKYMPYIELEDFVSDVEQTTRELNRKILKIRVTYSVQLLAVTKRALELVFELM
jgi:phage baseplate assembly protein W